MPSFTPKNPLHPDFENQALGQRSEITTVGVDETSQIIGADPFGRQAGLGLRVPHLALANATAALSRYLFLLNFFEVPAGRVAHIRGYRQLVTLGADIGGEGHYRPVEQEIESPYWHPPGGNISWHLQKLGPPGTMGIPGIDPSGPPGSIVGVDNFAFRMAKGPALLYETATLAGGYYVDLSAYTPPNGGQPYGVPLIDGGFSTRYDLSAPWRSAQAWRSLDIVVQGPCAVGAFVSLRQANTSVSPYANTAPANPSGTPIEEQFLTNYPTANYWRIAMALVVDF